MNAIHCILFLGLVSVAYSLKCYECEGKDVIGQENVCGDTFDKSSDKSKAILKTCNSSALFCRKEKTGVNKVFTNIERGCAEQCEDQNQAFIRRVTCCRSDGCNTAAFLTSSVFLVLGLVSIVVSFLKTMN